MKHALLKLRAAAILLCTAPALALAADTPIYTIQGSGALSPLQGQVVTTTGVVTRVNNNGFFMQDPTGDGNALTSDGIFVFTSSAPTVSVGQWLRLSGTVTEFNVGSASNADTLAHRVTELTGISGLQVLGSGVAIAPVAVTLPEAANDDLEHFEGMLVTINGPFTVGQNYFQGRYGQLTLSVGGRLETPTNRYRPGAQAQALADQNARRRIILDDGSSRQNPDPTPYFAANGVARGGDTVQSLTGVIDYGLATASNAGFGDYKLHPTVAPVFSATHARPPAPAPVGGNVRLAAMNVLNYFTTFTDGNTAGGQTGQGCTEGANFGASLCRGANNAAEFARQRAKIVEAMAALDGDVVGLMEIQNNANVALQNLVDALNARVGAGTYAPLAVPAGGTGSDAIRVAMIYKPARLQAVGAALADTAPVHNRPPLAQTFAAANGLRFSVVVNHFKSKGSCPASGADADQGDGQGCWNATRVQQAQQLRAFVAQLQQASGSSDVLIVGDLNAYAQEDPVADLAGNGFVDQIARFVNPGYSYVFDGAAGRLDHAIASTALSPKVAGVALWHINADESLVYDYNLEFRQPACATCAPDAYQPDAYRSSDHDPLVLGLNLYKPVTGSTGRDTLVGSTGDDAIHGGSGADVLSGNGGNNLFAYTSLRDAGDTVTDFVPGKDRIDLRGLFAALDMDGAELAAAGFVRFVALRGGTSIEIDIDGPAAGAQFRPLLWLSGVAPAGLNAARDLLTR